VIAAFDHLRQEIDRAWDYARQSWHSAQMAHDRAILPQQEVQRAYCRTLTACMAPSMPTANAWTREITAIILASHGLLDKTSARRRPAEGRHRRPARPRRPAKGRPR
jgi:hypothetical protein